MSHWLIARVMSCRPGTSSGFGPETFDLGRVHQREVEAAAVSKRPGEAEGEVVFHDAGSEDVEEDLTASDRLVTKGVAEAPDPGALWIVLQPELPDGHVLPAEAGAIVVTQLRGL